MKVVVFGASGKVGRLVVTELLKRGHEVVAFTHSRNIEKNAGLQVVKGNVHDAAEVADAVKGCEAVVSALGSWGTPGKDVLSSGMASIIPAMKAAGIERVISLTGSDARAPGDHLGLVHMLSYPLLKLVGAKVLADGEKHIQLLADSDLSWTVIRSPVMNGFGESYQLGDKRPMPWASINRQSVVKAMVELAENGQHARQAPYIRRR